MKLFVFATLLILASCSAALESPTVLKNFEEPVSPEEVIDFVTGAAKKTGKLELRFFGESKEGTELILIRTQNKTNHDPLKILIFAQQHGNEQSGKEATLLLIRDLANKLHKHWLGEMEIWIVPQLNPDGGRRNERRNGMGLDLNRDHLVQQAPETRALHSIFREFLPHVTIDIHEYQPFRPAWEKFGGYKNFDVQVGIPTNTNVSEEIRKFALNDALPAIEKHLKEKGFSFHNYLVGPPPDEGRTRHSTTDINDGRQSFAILNTMSFIFEGINGKDGYIDKLERRAQSQYEALTGLLEFLHNNNSQVKAIVNSAREELRNSNPGDRVAIRMEHFHDGSNLLMPLLSSRTGMDTLILVDNYHPVVQATMETDRPEAYLIPVNDSLLTSFLGLHGISYKEFIPQEKQIVSAWLIEKINNNEDEELDNYFPQARKIEIKAAELTGKYYLISTRQLHANFLVTVFEPQSMLGLAQREGFEYLLQQGTYFPVLRIDSL